MMRLISNAIAAMALLFSCLFSGVFFAPVLAQDNRERAAQEVLQEVPDSGSPPAQIEQAAWLAGHWQGVSDEGDEVLESWLGPKGAMMAGVALYTEKSEELGSESQWSEHMVIVSEGQSLAFHYNVLDAIAGGGGFIKRRLIRIEGDGCKLFFQSITFECKRDEDAGEVVGMTIYWQEPADDWIPEPELFTYRYTRVR